MVRMTFLGTGTSHGIPVIGCGCRVCRSEDPRNNRMRASVLIEHGRHRYVVDTGQEFRIQAIRSGLDSLDAVFYTHNHADHLYGIDDLRIFTRRQPLPVYGSEETLQEITERFAYIFAGDIPGGGVPSLDLRAIPAGGIELDGLPVIPVPIYHGRRIIFGYRFGTVAYLTDCSGIPPESYRLLEGLEAVVVGALRETPHPTHYSVGQAVDAIERMGAKRGYLTHMCHQLEHSELNGRLPGHIEPAWDGLQVTLPSEYA